MAGIFGLMRRDGGDVAPRDLARMAERLAPVAPAGCRSAALGELGLGICRSMLRSIDRRDGEVLIDPESGITIAASARLDDRSGLGAALGVAPSDLAGVTDSALILRAWLKWGEGFAAHLLGDFIIAVWDERRRRLMIARDPMGQRDLFYHAGPDILAFAPEVSSLWALREVPRALEDTMLRHALTHDFTGAAGATMFTGIQSLAGGHLLVAEPGKPPVVRSYWEPLADPAHLGRDEAYYVEAWREVLGEAVATRLEGLEKPPGLLLSGGFDSSAIAGLARAPLARAGHRMFAAASVMPTDYSGKVRHAGGWIDLCERDMPWIDIRRVTRDGMDPILDLERRLVARQTLPSVYNAVDDALCATLASAGAGLVLDGQGGDYTLNPRSRRALARWLATGDVSRFTRELLAARRVTGRSLRSLVARDIAPHFLPARLRRWKEARQRARLPVQHSFLGQTERTEARKDRSGGTSWAIDFVRRGSGSSAMYARHGLTLSRPFHDRRVVELALAIPLDLHIRNGRNRHLARLALADVYPVEFQQRGPANDDPFPDFHAAIDRVRPQLIADIGRMGRSASLSAMIDFSRLGAMLEEGLAEGQQSGWEQRLHGAMNAYCVARYVEWFRQHND